MPEEAMARHSITPSPPNCLCFRSLKNCYCPLNTEEGWPSVNDWRDRWWRELRREPRTGVGSHSMCGRESVLSKDSSVAHSWWRTHGLPRSHLPLPHLTIWALFCLLPKETVCGHHPPKGWEVLVSVEYGPLAWCAIIEMLSLSLEHILDDTIAFVPTWEIIGGVCSFSYSASRYLWGASKCQALGWVLGIWCPKEFKKSLFTALRELRN